MPRTPRLRDGLGRPEGAGFSGRPTGPVLRNTVIGTFQPLTGAAKPIAVERKGRRDPSVRRPSYFW